MTLYIDTKPQLEWIEYNGRHMADGYEVHQERSNGRWYWSYYDMVIETLYYDSIELAKQAAQDDYKASKDEYIKPIELPKLVIPYQTDNAPYNAREAYHNGWNNAIRAIHEAIAKATTPESLHTKP
jgi:hypothetical protein